MGAVVTYFLKLNTAKFGYGRTEINDFYSQIPYAISRDLKIRNQATSATVSLVELKKYHFLLSKCHFNECFEDMFWGHP